MGLLDKLTTEGSAYTEYDGLTPAINPLATRDSKLHADNNTEGYSLNGQKFSEVNPSYQAYSDGYNNNLPQPTILDRTNITRYSDNFPEGVSR